MNISCKASIVVICCITFALAQAPDTLWTRTYGGAGNDEGHSILQASDSSYLILGTTQSFGSNDDIYLIKAAQNGDTLWTRTYGGPYTADGYAIRPTNDGGYIIIGYTDMVDASYDCYFVKIDQNGDTLWTRTYGAIGSDEEGFAGGQTSDGGYIITGVTCEYDVNGDVYLIKTDANGDTIWTRHYGSNSMDYGISVQEIAGGGYIIAGATEANANDDVYLVKTDANGDTVWTRTFGVASFSFDLGYSVVQTPDSGYLIAGWTAPYTFVNADVYLIRTDAAGDTIWTRTYGGADDDYALYIQATTDNNYIMTGFTYSYGAGECDVNLLKIDPNGDTIWTTVFGGASFDAGFSLAQTVDGGYVIVGFTDSYGIGGDVYVIKTGPDLGIEEAKQMKSGTKTQLFEITPNPAQDVININYMLSQKTRVTVDLFDVAGRHIQRLTDDLQDKGVHHETLRMARLPEGIYFVRFSRGGHSETKKIVLLK